MAASTILKYPLNDVAIGTVIYNNVSNTDFTTTSGQADSLATVPINVGVYYCYGSYTIAPTGTVDLRGASLMCQNSADVMVGNSTIFGLGGNTAETEYSAIIEGISTLTFQMMLVVDTADNFNFYGLSIWLPNSGSTLVRSGWSLVIVKAG